MNNEILMLSLMDPYSRQTEEKREQTRQNSRAGKKEEKSQAMMQTLAIFPQYTLMFITDMIIKSIFRHKNRHKEEPKLYFSISCISHHLKKILYTYECSRSNVHRVNA